MKFHEYKTLCEEVRRTLPRHVTEEKFYAAAMAGGARTGDDRQNMERYQPDHVAVLAARRRWNSSHCSRVKPKNRKVLWRFSILADKR